MQFPSRWRFLDLLQLGRVVSPICVWCHIPQVAWITQLGMGRHLTRSLVLCPLYHSALQGSQRALLLPENQRLAGSPLGPPEPWEERQTGRQEPVFSGLRWPLPAAEAELTKGRHRSCWGRLKPLHSSSVACCLSVALRRSLSPKPSKKTDQRHPVGSGGRARE